MRVSEIMTDKVEFLQPDTNLREAAQKMFDHNCGFFPISNREEQRLLGVITDRDIVVRAVAEGRDPESTSVSDAMSARVLYCFATDDLLDAIESMQAQKIYRLVVLDNATDKRLAGIITLGDIVRHGETEIAERAAQSISQMAA